MGLLKAFDRRDLGEVGEELHRFAAELYPICRSITGDGIRRTLAMIGDRIPLKTFEVPTGTAGLRLDRAKRMEYSRCLYQESRRDARCGLPEV